MTGPAMPAARKGDRITHSARLDDSSSEATLGAALGALVAEVGHAGVMAAQIGAGIAAGARDAAGKITIAFRAVVPNDTSGAIEEGSPDTFLGGPDKQAALAAAQTIDCHHHRDKPIQKGSISVFVNGKLLARASDPTGCGAMICDGAETVLIGGAPADGAPTAPVALAAREAVGSAVAVAQSIATAAEGAVSRAARYGAELADSAARTVKTTEATVVAAGNAIEGEIRTDVREIAGVVRGGILGTLLGSALANQSD